MPERPDDDGMDPSTYGDRIAGLFDEPAFSGASDPDRVAQVLAELADGGAALELGIGTGNFALALAARGVEVHGIEVSTAMVDRLQAKPGGSAIPVTLGDVADVQLHRTFALVYAVYNTLFYLFSQEQQVRCFENVARHLEPGGAFLVEAFVLGPQEYELSDQEVRAEILQPTSTALAAERHDPVDQVIREQQVVLRDRRVGTYPAKLRYAWPSELDLMARLAGLTLAERWGGWSKIPFSSASWGHISIYRRRRGNDRQG